MIEYQQTIKGPFSVMGRGLHTGANARATILPSAPNSGIKFCRVDLEKRPIIEAIATNVIETTRGTVLSNGEASVSTVEHLMSALYAYGIDNATIEIDGPEVPILDGSSLHFAVLLSKEETVKSNYLRPLFEVKEPIHHTDKESGSSIAIYPADNFSVEVMIDFNSKVLGYQTASYDPSTNYLSQIAPCRTFVFVHDLIPLLNNNLIKGGELENAIVINEDRVEGQQLKSLERVFGKTGRQYLERGYLNREELKFPNECARHKLLDLLGDLYLTGFSIKGRVVAKKPGHKINTETAKLLIKMYKEYEKR